MDADLKTSVRRFHEEYAPLRSELYRFCRHLTRTPWDAEDLVQDTLARALVTLGTLIATTTIANPRAWLFRVASNLWIDRVRHARDLLGDVPEASAFADPRPIREAAGTLIARLTPQERVAVVLKEAFDLSLDEIADALGTTPGAVSAALHRGRGKLTTLQAATRHAPAPAVLDAFCAAFNAGDLGAITRLLLDGATVEMPGAAVDLGVAVTANPVSGILYHTVMSTLKGGVPSHHLGGYLGSRARAELREYRDGHVILLWYSHDTGDAVRSLIRLDTEDDRISRVRAYFFSPEVLAEVCAELAVPCRGNGHSVD